MKTIAIIGGGFSGTITAVNLARFSESPLRVCLINRGYPVGRGVAYSTRQVEHLLNVAARNMSALADHPHHFVEWLQTRSEYAEVPEAELRETYVPRRVFGDYLRGLLLRYWRPTEAGARVRIEIVDDEAVDILPREHGADVLLAGGTTIEADKVLLATGNQPPAEMPTAAAGFHHPRYVENPWQDWSSRLPDKSEPVVLLGAGLTMVDAFLTLQAHGWQGPLTAVSRHGILPLSHFRGIEYADFPPPGVATLRLKELVELVEEHCGRLRGLGANPAIVVDKLRPHTQRVWQNLSLDEKREFCRLHAARWNVTRHRIAQQIHQRLSTAIADGALRVVKGSICGLHGTGQGVGVVVEHAPGRQRTIEAGLVINCTGPCASFSAVAAPLLQKLLGSGRVQVDALDMGVEIEADFAVVEPDGSRSSCLYAMGPLVKGVLWETTAVPELRSQAFRVAQVLLDELSADQRAVEAWPIQPEVEVLEYCI
ncbi:MAG TPA: FAD/NAD(P)-binding protein [Pirellulales bacterium]